MPGLQKQLNPDRDFGRCFAGDSNQSDEDKQCAYYQHGLYFGHDGKLLENHPYNAEKIALLKKLGLSGDEVTPEEIIKTDRVPLNPEVVGALSAESDDAIYDGAMKLVEELTKAGTPTEYVPDVAMREDNIRFIAEHVS